MLCLHHRHGAINDVPEGYAPAVFTFVHSVEISADIQVGDGEIDQEVPLDVQLLIEKGLLLDSLLQVPLHYEIVELRVQIELAIPGPEALVGYLDLLVVLGCFAELRLQLFHWIRTLPGGLDLLHLFL